MFPFAHVICFTVFQVFTSLATSLTAWDVSASEIVRQLWMSSIVVDNWLYIDGGEYYLAGTSSYDSILYPPTLSIDLSTSWTNSSVIIYQISKPNNVGNLSHEGLFWQESTRAVLVFGGSFYGTEQNSSIWALSVGNQVNGDGNWTLAHSTTDPIWQHVTWPQQPSFAFSPTGGYALGGYATVGSNSDPTALLDMTAVNTTTDAYTMTSDIGTFSSPGGVSQGAGQFVPSFGTGAGIAVFFGGVYYTTSNSQPLHSMTQITIYDIATNKWYTQTAGGDVPQDRKNICITGAQGTNTSTYEIFVYGGSGVDFFSSANSDSQNVYILTLPAFRWIRTAAKTAPRAGASCQTIKNQMLSFGGFDPTGAASFSVQDPWTFGIGVFDLTALTWKSEFNPDAAAYVQSHPVTNFYATNPAYPIWDNKAIAPLFAAASSTVSSVTSTAGSNPTSSTSSKPKTPQRNHSKTPVAAIAGGTVGGVILLAAVVLAVWFCYARKAKTERLSQDPHHNLSELHDTQAYPELGTETVPEMQGAHTSQNSYVTSQKEHFSELP